MVSCMARTNATCHVPFRDNPNMDTAKLPSFGCVERRWLGPNQIGRSAANIKFVKSRSMGHWYEPRGIRDITIKQIGLLASVLGRAKSLRSKSVQPFDHKEQKSQNMCHVPMARGTEYDAINWLYSGH